VNEFENERRVVRALALLAAVLFFAWAVEQFHKVRGDEPLDRPLSAYAPDANYIERDGFLAGRPNHTGLSPWVLEDLDELDGPGDRNKSHWHVGADALPERHARDVDYLNSGQSRGHLRSAGDAKRSQARMDATHDLLNIVPQAQEFNAGSWFQLEEHARALRRKGARVKCITLPCWIPQVRTDHRGVKSARLIVQTIGPDELWVPTHLAKSLLIETDEGRRVETYLAPNSDNVADRDIESFRITTNEVERITITDLWPAPPDLKPAARAKWLREQDELEAHR